MTLILTLLIIAVGLVALASGTGAIPLPYEMFLLEQRMPIVFRAHMITSALALVFIPVVIAIRHRHSWHRMLGRVVGAFVVAGGLTALPVAIFSDSSPAARTGFFVQGLVWMYLLAKGVAAIRARERARHAQYMVAMFAVTTGAIWFRLMIGTAIALHMPFEPIYAAAAWLGWVVPLSIVVAFPQLRSGLFTATTLPSPQAVEMR